MSMRNRDSVTTRLPLCFIGCYGVLRSTPRTRKPEGGQHVPSPCSKVCNEVVRVEDTLT